METYTIVEHSVLDSTAARLLSTGGYATLIDFMRVWKWKSRNNARPNTAISFTWSSCSRPLWPKTWKGHRQQLVEKGFIEVVNKKTGMYRWSEEWRNYEPNNLEKDILGTHDQARLEQVENTVEYRQSRLPPTTRGSKATPTSNTEPEGRGQKMPPAKAPDGESKLPLTSQGAKTAPYGVGGQNCPHSSTEVQELHTPTPTAQQGKTLSAVGDNVDAALEAIRGEGGL